MKPIPRPRVNHQAERPTLQASWDVPTVAPPPMHVPAMAPATREVDPFLPLRLNPSADLILSAESISTVLIIRFNLKNVIRLTL